LNFPKDILSDEKGDNACIKPVAALVFSGLNFSRGKQLIPGFQDSIDSKGFHRIPLSKIS